MALKKKGTPEKLKIVKESDLQRFIKIIKDAITPLHLTKKKETK